MTAYRLQQIIHTLALSLILWVPLQNAPAMARIELNKIKTEKQNTNALSELPRTGVEVHKINRMALAVTNNGFFGTGYFRGRPVDPETGKSARSCIYPINSNIEYLWTGALWFGAIVGHDTLVSIGAGMYYYNMELWPNSDDGAAIIRKSNQPFSRNYALDAVSEEDIIAHYTDTVTNPALIREDPIDNRPHQPLNLDISQKTYAWSYPYAEDFILFDFEIKNIGPYPIKKLYIGIVIEAIVFHTSKSGADETWRDDICGYKETIPSPFWPGYTDTVRVAWVADNDGDPNGRFFDGTSATSVTGVRVIRTPSDTLNYSFNWWITNFNASLDWGPRQVTEEKPFRSFGPTFGSAVGDRNKYYILSTPEFDYDQLECAVSHSGENWLNPPRNAEDFADGHNPIYLLSFGPFDVTPGQTLPVTMAYIAGEDFHHSPRAYDDLFDSYNPWPYMNQLDYSDLGLNSIWADWIYDNPGYDTDGDGDSGLAKWFYNIDSTDSNYEYYRGDGVPDFRGAAPPPSPRLAVTPDYGKLILRWNGQNSENFVDIFSGEKDFEGYKVYIGDGNRRSDFILVATYDKRNYNRYQWQPLRQRWEVSHAPLDFDSLVLIYGPDFDPELYTEQNSLRADDPRNPTGLYTYFTPVNWNDDDLSSPYGIHKAYPDADISDSSDTTDEGFHRFYEYEYIIDNLQPTRKQFVSVTAFDYGSRTHKLSALESSLLDNDIVAYPLPSVATVEHERLKVTVYPNPYRIDGGYARDGYENRERIKAAERARAIHFANLPRICTIRIFTIDGDLVKEIRHYFPEGGPEAQHETWNMISRNTQAITTGIYLWSVRSEMGEQIGKLVIIK
ncbi:MAG: hypothetical protein KAR42_00720 [candidate division Zixibacteria bacterium]|nr:hypothetical protein [candidate division Zixibacteria bacterium]